VDNISMNICDRQLWVTVRLASLLGDEKTCKKHLYLYFEAEGGGGYPSFRSKSERGYNLTALDSGP